MTISTDAIEVPYDSLNPNTLRAVVEEFITRNGQTMANANGHWRTRLLMLCGSFSVERRWWCLIRARTQPTSWWLLVPVVRASHRLIQLQANTPGIACFPTHVRVEGGHLHGFRKVVAGEPGPCE